MLFIVYVSFLLQYTVCQDIISWVYSVDGIIGYASTKCIFQMSLSQQSFKINNIHIYMYHVHWYLMQVCSVAW